VARFGKNLKFKANMGLTINYKLSVAENFSSAVVRELVHRAGLYAKKIGCAEVSDATRVTADTPFTRLFARAGREEDACFGLIPAKRGWVVEVWPGGGCESAFFGLCQYPRRAAYELRGKRGFAPTEYKGGWLFKGSCKTPYANEYGWPHFLRCHKTIISILEFWQKLGVTVETRDEGGYWESRSEEQLKNKLRQYDGLLAMVSGVFKDATTATFPTVESPIFARNDFERLEAEGWREFGRRLSQLRTSV
jgi:hypothetical protein